MIGDINDIGPDVEAGSKEDMVRKLVEKAAKDIDQQLTAMLFPPPPPMTTLYWPPERDPEIGGARAGIFKHLSECT